MISSLHNLLSTKSAALHRVLNLHYRAEHITGGTHGQSFATDVLKAEFPVATTAASNASFTMVFFINSSP